MKKRRAVGFTGVLRQGAAKLGIALQPEEAGAMKVHYDLLRRWNETARLTSITHERRPRGRGVNGKIRELRVWKGRFAA